MNSDDHKDLSIWRDFLETKGVFMSNATLSQVAIDVATELEDRKRTVSETNDKIDSAFKPFVVGDTVRANRMESIQDIADGMSDILGTKSDRNRSPF